MLILWIAVVSLIFLIDSNYDQKIYRTLFLGQDFNPNEKSPLVFYQIEIRKLVRSSIILFLSIIFICLKPFRETDYFLLQLYPNGPIISSEFTNFFYFIHPLLVAIGFSFTYFPFIYDFSFLFSLQSAYNPSLSKPADLQLVSSRKSWRYAIISSILLLFGLLSGSLWAFTEKNWGYLWQWDPIELHTLIAFLINIIYLLEYRFSFLATKISKIPHCVIFSKIITRTVYSFWFLIQSLLITLVTRTTIWESLHTQGRVSILVVVIMCIGLLALFIILLFKFLSIFQNKKFTLENANKNSPKTRKSNSTFQKQSTIFFILNLYILFMFGINFFISKFQNPVKIFNWITVTFSLIIFLNVLIMLAVKKSLL